MTARGGDQLDQLMDLAVAGDGVAYARFLKNISSELRSFIRGKLFRSGANASDLEDILQETLLAIHTKRHTWRVGEPVKPWVFAIARHKLIDTLRKRGRRSEVDIEDHIDTLQGPQEEESLSSRDVDRALGTLPQRQREVVVAISLDGQAIGEVARRFAMTEGAVRVALHRGLTSLYAKFGKN